MDAREIIDDTLRNILKNLDYHINDYPAIADALGLNNCYAVDVQLTKQELVVLKVLIDQYLKCSEEITKEKLKESE